MHIITQTEDSVALTERESSTELLTNNDMEYLFEQMYLFEKNPVNVLSLDSIFSESLRQNGIPAQTAVMYEGDGIKHCSTTDSSFYASALKLDDVVLLFCSMTPDTIFVSIR